MEKKIAIMACGAALGAIALIPSSAGAYSAACSSGNESGGATFTADRNEIDRVSIGTNSDGSGTHLRYTGVTSSGDPFDNSIGCSIQGSGAKAFAISLGDLDDSARADGEQLASSDYVAPGPAVDVAVRGGGGDDRLIGNVGGGIWRGGSGDDSIRDPGGSDVIKGGAGDDAINAKDGRRDLVDCGGGDDTVKADPFDELHNCR